MIGKSTLKHLLKLYPALQDHYRFYGALLQVSSNRALRKKKPSSFAKNTAQNWERFSIEEEARPFLEGYLASAFQKDPPCDALLHLAEDLVILSLLLFLKKECSRQEREERWQKALLLFEASIFIDYGALFTRYSKVHRILSSRDLFYYTQSDKETQKEIRAAVYRYAKRHGIGEKDAAATIPPSFFRQELAGRRRYFRNLLLLLPILLFAVALVYCGLLPSLFLILPIFTLCCEMVFAAASLSVTPAPLFKLKRGPIKQPVLVVITALFTSKEEIVRLSKRLEVMYFQNPEENVFFGLLADFKDSKKESEPADEMLEKAAHEQISALNARYGEHFCLFLRRRSYAPADGIYMGWERKRGALIDLVRFIKGKEHHFCRIVAPKELLSGCAYLLTLDADTDLRIGAVSTMYATMRHPENKPVIENGVVASGYGVLQPRMVTSVSSASRSPFALLHSGGGGLDNYRNALFDFYQSVFGKGAFCGKGMFDVDAFDKVICDAFPEGQILSHDLLEGTRLRCGYLSELALTDDAPSSALSFFARQHRWTRGDLQALPFARKKVFNGRKKIKNPIDRLSVFMILSNVTRIFTPLASLIALAFSTLLSESTCAVFLFFSFAYLLFPLALTAIRSARFGARRFYSSVMQSLWQSVCRTLFSLCALAYEAQLALDAALRVLYRKLISGKKLLEWVTADQGEKKYKNASRALLLLLHYKKALPSVAVGVLMVFLSHGGLLRLLSLGFVFFPLLCYLLSRPYKKGKALSEKQKKQLLRYAEDTFGYFERYVTENSHNLPPDNYQELPTPRLAERTSPTNIALYLTSCLAMADLELRSKEEMVRRIEDTLNTLCALPKYKGHLYNWYHTATLEVLGSPYISTVDSGNLVLCLLSLKSGLLEDGNANGRLIEKIDEILDGTDFSFLYRKDTGLLCIGYDPVEGRQSGNCYDLLASEARSAYFYAIAKGQIPVESWAKLGRPITVKEGHPGILSWSGTAFEYLMPALLLPIHKNSLLYEASCFALYEQAKDQSHGLWGRSESCYFSFDSAMNYQYRAFGSKALALDPETGKHDVLAPYASFLGLLLAPDGALSNLARFEQAGCYGSCGFYDAFDLTPERVGRGNAVIRNYMAHHAGMSITAAANTVKEGVFQRRTLSDPQMKAAEELLLERVPVDVPALPRGQRGVKRGHRTPPSPWTALKNTGATGENTLICKGATRILASDARGIALSFDSYALTPPLQGAASAPAILLKPEMDCHDLLKQPFIFDGRSLRYSLSKPEGKLTMKIAVGEGSFFFHFEKQGEGQEQIEIFLPQALCLPEEYLSHPSFSGLSVEYAYDEKEGLLLFKKRPKKQGVPPLFLAVAMTLPYRYSVGKRQSEQSFTLQNGQSIPCRLPDLYMFSTLPSAPCRFSLILTAGYSKDVVTRSIKEHLDRLTKTDGGRWERRPALWNKDRTDLPDRTLCLYVSVLLAGTLYARKKQTELPCYPINDLWQYGISGDLPIFTFLLPSTALSDSQKKTVASILRAHAYLSSSGVHFDLVFLRLEDEQYFSPAKKELEDLASGVTGKSLLKRRGGVHFLFSKEAQEHLPSFSTVFLFIERDCVFPRFKKAFYQCLDLEKEENIQSAPTTPRHPTGKKKAESALPCGTFLDDGFALADDRRAHPPFSWAYASPQFGTLVNDRSLGFTWFRNSGEFRLTPFSGSENRPSAGERLFLTLHGAQYDLAACAHSVRFLQGYALFEGTADVVDYRLYVGIDPLLPVKAVVLSLINRAPAEVDVLLEYRLTPCLGKRPDGLITERRVGDTLFFKRTAARPPADFGMYLSSSHEKMHLRSGKEEEALFLLGSVNLKNDRCYYHVKSRFRSAKDAFSAFKRYAAGEQAFSSPFSLSCTHPALSQFLDRYLPLQVRRVRLFAKTGFYQPGGAYGFRDQLQDALGLLYHDPRLLQRQIYRSAAHQYYGGDVQHWWHPISYDDPSPTDPGVRTECADDLLWLPFCCALYIGATGNGSILDKQIAYLSSPPLKEGEERYERPEKTARRESVYHHILRALFLVKERRSARGLCKMGSCDWNDGFSAVRGESVWLTQFYLLTLKLFAPYFRGDDGTPFQTLQRELADALKLHCRENDRYLRAFFEDGSPLGSQKSAYCQIDLLPQSFAVFLDHKDLFAGQAIDTAYRLLWQKESGLFRLFAPSFDKEHPFPGYLAGYCPGFRENGGQYTHAAVWGGMALLLAGRHEEGFEVLKGINPITHWQKSKPVYALEPYCMAGDVYFAKSFEGRGGWSQYTGSAGWYLLAILTVLLGYKEENDFFSLHPRLCDDFSSFCLTVNKKETVYRIEVAASVKEEILLDGKPSKNRFFFDKKKHTVKILLQKEKK